MHRSGTRGHRSLAVSDPRGPGRFVNVPDCGFIDEVSSTSPSRAAGSVTSGNFPLCGEAEQKSSATLGTPPRGSDHLSSSMVQAHFGITRSGSYACPVFQRLHRVEAMARATLRRALAGWSPASFQVWCRSANGLSAWAMADGVAPVGSPWALPVCRSQKRYLVMSSLLSASFPV